MLPKCKLEVCAKYLHAREDTKKNHGLGSEVFMVNTVVKELEVCQLLSRDLHSSESTWEEDEDAW